jgi:phosphotriesterase-related protein
MLASTSKRSLAQGDDAIATSTVATALGPVATTGLGATLMHEHIVTRSPGVHENWPHLFERNAILAMAQQKLADLHTRGIRTIVDLTTVDLGRDIDLIADVARRSPVQVIVATGVWRMPQRYFAGHGVDAVAELFVRDLTQGIGTSGVKAAIIKCATDTEGVTPVIETILRAPARAQKATGVPISTHTNGQRMRQEGATAGAGGMGPLTTADSSPVEPFPL